MAPPALTGAGFLTIVYVVSTGASPSVGMTATTSGELAPVGLAPTQTTLKFNVYRATVEPIFLEDRGGYGLGQSVCVTCHVQSGTPLKLQPLQEDGSGGVYWTEAQSRMNFGIVSGLVMPGEPDRSLLLREPLAESAGGSAFHVGGKFWDSRDHSVWQTIAAWVRTADVGSAPSREVMSLPDFQFFRTCVQRIFLDREDDRMECQACHNSGVRGFAQTIPDGRDYWNEAESRQNYGIILRYIEPGYPLRSRFLTHPLDPHGGGDNYHSGGRRWDSQADPEWRMLARWVRGQTPTTCSVEDK
jgi:hypothetical protein